MPRATPRSDRARVRRVECITPTREGSGQTRTVTCTALFGCSVHRLLPAMLGVAGAVHAGVDRVMMPRNRHHNTVSMHRLLWLILVVPQSATATDGCVRRSGPGVIATHARWNILGQLSSPPMPALSPSAPDCHVRAEAVRSRSEPYSPGQAVDGDVDPVGTQRSAVCVRSYSPPPIAGGRGVLYTGSSEGEFVCASTGDWSGSITCGDLDPRGTSRDTYASLRQTDSVAA